MIIYICFFYYCGRANENFGNASKKKKKGGGGGGGSLLLSPENAEMM